MAACEPIDNTSAKADRQHENLVGFAGRCRAGTLVVCQVALSADTIECVDEGSVRADGQAKRLDRALVRTLPFRPEAFRGQREHRQLERGVVRDVEAPVGTQPIDSRVHEISINDREEVGDFFRTYLVRGEPPAFEPVFQRHRWYPGA